MDDPVTIAIEDPGGADVRPLIEALDDYLIDLYPSASNHLLGLEALRAEDISFYVAREAGRALGCGALNWRGPDYAEIKRMYVAPTARGRHLGQRLLRHLEEQALVRSIEILRLETGIHQPEAIGLYRAAGYLECPPFGNYSLDPLSLFMEKYLH